MTLSRKKPGVAFWATVVVVVALVEYPLSFPGWTGAAHSTSRAAISVCRPPMRQRRFSPEHPPNFD
jgi:hypothetical protein